MNENITVLYSRTCNFAGRIKNAKESGLSSITFHFVIAAEADRVLEELTENEFNVSINRIAGRGGFYTSADIIIQLVLES